MQSAMGTAITCGTHLGFVRFCYSFYFVYKSLLFEYIRIIFSQNFPIFLEHETISNYFL